MHVRMTTLVELDGRDHAHDVHEARVELKVVKTRTHVIGRAEYALHDQADAHRVEQSEVLRNAMVLLEETSNLRDAFF